MNLETERIELDRLGRRMQPPSDLDSSQAAMEKPAEDAFVPSMKFDDRRLCWVRSG
jgi:hypothetical protein